jgi:hypothetical protein
MPVVDITRDTDPSPLPESGEFASEQIEVSPGVADHAPRYVERVLAELRSLVAGARCPIHGCGSSLTVDLSSEQIGTLDVVAHNCCPRLDDVVSRALRGTALFRLILPR